MSGENSPPRLLVYYVVYTMVESSVLISLKAMIALGDKIEDVILLEKQGAQDLTEAQELVQDQLAKPLEELVLIADDVRVKKLCSA